MNRLRVLALPLLSALLLALAACAAPATPMPETAPPPVTGVPTAIAAGPQIDTRCRTDSDCAV
ncbi:hypothetical protein [Luteimonas cellulosilyticus]|nr:hypothetical protein [Luteimonas cellulosilyticus]